MHILGLVRSHRTRTRLARDASGWARVTVVDTAAAAETTLRSDCVDALLLELNPAADVGAHEAFVRRVRGGFPSLPVVLYTPLTREAAKQIIRLANAGADELVLEGYDDGRNTLQRLIVRAHVSRCAARSLGAISEWLAAPTRAILVQAMHLAERPLSVGGLALAVGVNRKTLVNRLAAAGLPGPETVISRCRLLLACELLEDPGRSVEQVGLLLGFGSGVALRNMFRRHLGIPPSALRRTGCFEEVVRRWFAPSAITCASRYLVPDAKSFAAMDGRAIPDLANVTAFGAAGAESRRAAELSRGDGDISAESLITPLVNA